MTEYIEREVAIKAIYDNDCEGYATWAIKAVPAADVRPVVRGKWLHKKITADFHAIGQCSVCKEIRRIDNFCPNCGADMRDDDDIDIPMEYFESGGI